MDIGGGVKGADRGGVSISSFSIKSNWGTELSSWEDFRALLHTGTKLTTHPGVAKLKRDLEPLEEVDASTETIDEIFKIKKIVKQFLVTYSAD